MPYGDRTVWIGYDDKEAVPYAVARHSVRAHCRFSTPIFGVVLQDLINNGLYTRQIEHREVAGKEIMWDPISGAPMSTQFAISRFFILELAQKAHSYNRGWALFVDCDVLLRSPIEDLFFAAELQPEKALVCVPHQQVVESDFKKDGQLQAKEVDSRFPGKYTRKNWSSVMLLNRIHPANKGLTLELLNTAPGRDLHRFCWLKDDEIGYLDSKWNYLVGVDSLKPGADPCLVHFTNGGPWLPQYKEVEYAEEWRAVRDDWVRHG